MRDRTARVSRSHSCNMRATLYRRLSPAFTGACHPRVSPALATRACYPHDNIAADRVRGVAPGPGARRGTMHRPGAGVKCWCAFKPRPEREWPGGRARCLPSGRLVRSQAALSHHIGSRRRCNALTRCGISVQDRGPQQLLTIRAAASPRIARTACPAVLPPRSRTPRPRRWRGARPAVPGPVPPPC